MPSSPLVSIVTPSYNQSDFLEPTIRSVLAQDYERIEYLIVDGASSDSSVEIIQRYAELASDRIVWWVSEPDSGQSEAINKGFKQATGEIIAWLNSDDLYLPGAVSQAVALMQANPDLGLVFGNAITIDVRGQPLNKLTFDIPEKWGLAELLRFHIICQPAVFMRRSVLEKAGFLDSKYHFMLDHHLWIRIASLAPIQYTGSCRNTSPSNAFEPGLWAAARHHQAAKNVAQAEQFGEETLAVLDWAQTQPHLRPMIANDRRRVFGGAYRLNARYLLDGGSPGSALRSYWRALFFWPRYTLRHWHRILYALLQTLRLDSLLARIDRFREKKNTEQRRHLAAELRNHLYQAEVRLNSQKHNSDKWHATGTRIWPGLLIELEDNTQRSQSR